MLIIPVQDRVEWRRPPLLVLALVLLNSVIFFACSQHDDDIHTALERQPISELARYEHALAREHLIDTSDMPVYEIEQMGAEAAFHQVMYDRSFDQRVVANQIACFDSPLEILVDYSWWVADLLDFDSPVLPLMLQ